MVDPGEAKRSPEHGDSVGPTPFGRESLNLETLQGQGLML